MAPPPNKRRKTESKVAEINFDLSARQEFLTGFHKRKVARAKHAQEQAEKKAREERIAERKRIRDERKEDLERRVAELDALMKPNVEDEVDGDEDGDETVGAWNGIEDVPPPPVDHEAEYIDEDKYTTVTVEAMDASRDGLAKLGQDSDESANDEEDEAKMESKKDIKKPGRVKNAAEMQRNQKAKVIKKKRRNFRYESKGERKVSRTKERGKNSKQAKMRKAG